MTVPDRAKPAGEPEKGEAAKRRRRRRRLVKLSILLVIVLATVVLRMAVVRVYRADTAAIAPEVPKGARMLVYKLASSYEPGDIVLYRRGETNIMARVIEVDESRREIITGRNGEKNQKISFSDAIGRVILNTR